MSANNSNYNGGVDGLVDVLYMEYVTSTKEYLNFGSFLRCECSLDEDEVKRVCELAQMDYQK